MKTRALMVLALLLSTGFLSAETPDRENKILSKIGLSQNLNQQLPLHLPFRDATGKTVWLSDYFKGKPVILDLVYFKCPMLCTESLNGLVRAIRAISFDAGKQYQIVTVSFDPRETPSLAAAKKRVYTERYGRPGAASGWAFLTGPESSIRALAQTVGFHYVYDPELDQYAHATGQIVLTPEGKISRYLYGVEYSARDLRLALIDASHGKIGSPVDLILLYCYHYDPTTGKYGLIIFNAIRLAGIGTVLLLGFLIWILLRRERSAPAAA